MPYLRVRNQKSKFIRQLENGHWYKISAAGLRQEINFKIDWVLYSLSRKKTFWVTKQIIKLSWIKTEKSRHFMLSFLTNGHKSIFALFVRNFLCLMLNFRLPTLEVDAIYGRSNQIFCDDTENIIVRLHLTIAIFVSLKLFKITRDESKKIQ